MQNSDFPYLATTFQDWIDKALDKEFHGAEFYWTKERAKEFAAIPIEKLLLDEYFLNGKKWMYPGIIDTILDIWEERKKRRIRVICIIAGFGTGKTAGFGAALNWLNWFEFTCKYKEDSDIACPQEYYGHKSTSWVAFIALSKTLDKSKKITFSEMKPAFESPFNRDYFPINSHKQTMLEVPGNYTMVFPNTATEAANAGYNVYSFVMDEISFLEVIDTSSRSKGRSADTYDQAKEAFDSAYGRMTSRFGQDGMGVLISSVNYDEDFLMNKIRDAYNGKISESEVYFKVLLPWKVNPSKYSMKKYFYFDTDKFRIIEEEKEVSALDKYYVDVPIENIIFGSSLDDPNDQMLTKVRNGELIV